jgi:hypothetical protein
MTHRREDPEWPRGWEGHELAQLRRWRTWSFADKLRWLEEAHRIVKHLQVQRALRQRRGTEELPPAQSA